MDQTKIIKLLMLTTSDSDGECLNAIRAANRELQKHKLAWSDFLPRVRVAPEPPTPQAHKTYPKKTPTNPKNYYKGFICSMKTGNWHNPSLQTTVYRSDGAWKVVRLGAFLEAEFDDYREAIDFIMDQI